MAIQDDFTISYAGKTVEHTSGATVYTVLDFFQWLATTFAASSQMDDDYAFVSDTPTVYRWVNNWDFVDATADVQFLQGGSIESSDANFLYSNLYSIGSQEEGTKLYIIQNDEEVAAWWGTENIDILLEVKANGVLIDSGNVLVMARETDYSYDHNTVDLSGGGRNPVGINNAIDTNYSGLTDTGDIYIPVDSVASWNAGNYVLGATSGATARINYVHASRLYLVMIEGGPFNAAEVIDEGLTRGLTDGDASANTNGAQVDVVAGLGSGITLNYAGPFSRDLNNGDGFNNYDTTVVATGDTVLDVYQYLKYITRHGSVVAVDGDDGQEYLVANGYTSVKAAPFGTFAGGTFFGARGIWLEGTLTAAYILVDSSGAQQSPPDFQKVQVDHVNLSGTQIFVAEISAGEIIKNQYTIQSADSTSITTTTAININKTPQSGSLRVADTVYLYSSFDTGTDTFEGVSPDPSAETGAMYVPLMDLLADAAQELSDDIIFSASFNVRTTVRKYGFKEFTTDTAFGENGLTFSPILTADPQAT